MRYIVFAFILMSMSLSIHAQDFREVSFSQVDSLLNKDHEKLYVVNFWATWCKPCVAELPYFRKSAEKYKDDPVEFLFISLDFGAQVESKLKPFLQKDPLPGTSWWLNEKKLHRFIDQVDPRWSGAIPITLFLKGGPGDKLFWEGELDQGKLDSLIDEKIKRI
jgi:thiol-disulfide isomerase/thioredoxin